MDSNKTCLLAFQSIYAMYGRAYVCKWYGQRQKPTDLKLYIMGGLGEEVDLFWMLSTNEYKFRVTVKFSEWTDRRTMDTHNKINKITTIRDADAIEW